MRGSGWTAARDRPSSSRRAPFVQAEDMAMYLLCDRGFTQTSTMVVPREAARRIRFNEHLRAAEDTDFAIRLHLAGCRFRMIEEPGAIWNDRDDPARASADSCIEQPRAWLEEIRPLILSRAYHGARGWPYAKRIAKTEPLDRAGSLSERGRSRLLSPVAGGRDFPANLPWRRALSPCGRYSDLLPARRPASAAGRLPVEFRTYRRTVQAAVAA